MSRYFTDELELRTAEFDQRRRPMNPDDLYLAQLLAGAVEDDDETKVAPEPSEVQEAAEEGSDDDEN